MGPIKINLKFSGGASGKVAATCPNGPSSNLRSDRPYPEKNIMFWYYGITALDCMFGIIWLDTEEYLLWYETQKS